jgi:integrase
MFVFPRLCLNSCVHQCSTIFTQPGYQPGYHTMAEVIFVLKKVAGATPATELLIVLHYRCAGDQKLIMSTGEKLAEKNWSRDRQRAKPSYPKATALNALLDRLAGRVEVEAMAIKAEGRSVTRDELRDRLAEKKAEADSSQARSNVIDYLKQFIADQVAEHERIACGEKGAPELKKNTLKVYTTLSHYLDEYCRVKKKSRLVFEELDIHFERDFARHLKTRESSLIDSSIIKYLGTLKALKKRHSGHVKLGLKPTESDAVYLSESDLAKLYAAREGIGSYPNGQNLQVEVDRLVLGCCLGLRFGDGVTVQPEHVVHAEDGSIRVKIKTEKTGGLVTIPLLHTAGIEILERYGWASPKKVAEPTANRLFKEVCRIAEIDEVVTLGSGDNVPKWQQVTTHTMRRSFCTNHYLNGVPSILLMKISGHKTERAFLRYIRIDRLQAADLIIKHYTERNQLRAI